ncbi:unnamed protein product [Candidula unifasciata]|uniref:Tetraspanin n=1 Tax=Candidula unifasciata TaxID=100452 RepID=A0A8S3ZDD0_9EUPU|nr:unnamed protein product [Candidula unifasciata]
MAMLALVRVMKWMLFVFNILILCAGAIAIGLGAWGLGSEYGAEKLKDLTGSQLYRGAAIAIIVGGCVVVVIALIGAIGAIRENRILLGIYFVVTLLLLILFVVAASVGYAYKDIVQEKIAMEMESTLVNRYGVDIDNNNDNNDVTNVWDDLQRKLMCCGVKGRTPGSLKSWYLWQSSKWFNSTNNIPKKLVPESCCNPNYNATMCYFLNPDPSRPVQTSVDKVTHESEYVYYKGCLDKLVDYVEDHIVAIAGIAVAIIVVMFLCLLFAMCVCTHVGKKSLVV